jgi:hypothetical protein
MTLDFKKMAEPGGEVHFKRFHPEAIRDYSSILFAGGKRTGKSSVMREFMWYLKDRVYDAHIWSGTVDEEHLWEWYTPKQMVHYCLEEFDDDALKAALSTQHERKTLARKFGAKCPPSLCVFEDLEFLKPSIWVKQATRGVIFNGRWYKEFFFVAYQYVMEIKMEMRGSFDYAVFTMDCSTAVRERIWKQFGGVFKSFEEFEAVFKMLTTAFSVMVIDLRARSYDIRDCIFWYRANPNLGSFKMGHPDVWNSARIRQHAQQQKQEPAQMIPGMGRIVLLDDTKKKKKKLSKKSRIH